MNKLLILLVIITVSCGKKVENKVDNSRYFETVEKLYKAISNSSVICGESISGCPDNVAKLSFWVKESEGYQLAVCSGTLIDQNYIITNRHCIPDNIQVNGASCNKQIIIQFPDDVKNHKQMETLNCKNVVQVFKNKNTEPDLAVLRIEKSKYARQSVTINKFAFVHSQKNYAYTMNPNRYDRDLGIIKRKDCKVSLDNLLYGKSNNFARSALLYGSNCNVIGGNSGSGLFDQNNNLIGVINMTILNNNLKNTLKRNSIPVERLTHMGIAVNIGCLNNLYRAEKSDCNSLRSNSLNPTFQDYLNQKVLDLDLQDFSENKIEFSLSESLDIKLKYSDDYIAYEKRFSIAKPGLLSLFDKSSRRARAKILKIFK